LNTDAFLDKTYAEINDNIKFSEAKNAALITLNSALIALGSGTVFDSKILCWYRILIAVAVLFLIAPLLCSIFSFRATTGSEGKIVKHFYGFLNAKNRIPSTPKKYMYYAFIHKHFSNDPVKYLEETSPNENRTDEGSLSYQMARQIVDLAGVAYRKFILFNIAIKIEIAIFSGCGIVALIMLLIKCFSKL